MIIKVDVDKSNGIKIRSEQQIKTFKEWGLKEEHIEEFVINNASTIFGDEETLLIVGRQLKDRAHKTNDFLFVDAEGSLVLVEIKRDASDIRGRSESLEFQAIRYAASLATIKTPEELITKSLIPYLRKNDNDHQGERTVDERARKILLSFFKKNNISVENFNRKQKIRLISSPYDETTLSACAWLINNGIDMKLIQLTPLEIDGDKSISIETILPLEKNEDYYVEIKDSIDKRETLEKPSLIRKELPKMDKLFEWEILKKGDKIFIKGSEDSIATVIDHRTVNYQGKVMTYNEWGTMITDWISIQIYRYAYLEGTSESLDDLRMKELEKRNANE